LCNLRTLHFAVEKSDHALDFESPPAATFDGSSARLASFGASVWREEV
jgi:hypothetical protein